MAISVKIHRVAPLFHSFQIELELKCWFLWRKENRSIRQKTLGQDMMSGLRFEPGSHWWEASALTTVPSLLPIIHLTRPCWLHSFGSSDPQETKSTMYTTINFYHLRKGLWFMFQRKCSMHLFVPGLQQHTIMFLFFYFQITVKALVSDHLRNFKTWS